MRIVVDRIEGDFAVLELPDKSTINVNAALFDSIKEGDILKLELDREAMAEASKSSRLSLWKD